MVGMPAAVVRGMVVRGLVVSGMVALDRCVLVGVLGPVHLVHNTRNSTP